MKQTDRIQYTCIMCLVNKLIEEEMYSSRNYPYLTPHHQEIPMKSFIYFFKCFGFTDHSPPSNNSQEIPFN